MSVIFIIRVGSINDGPFKCYIYYFKFIPIHMAPDYVVIIIAYRVLSFKSVDDTGIHTEGPTAACGYKDNSLNISCTVVITNWSK